MKIENQHKDQINKEPAQKKTDLIIENHPIVDAKLQEVKSSITNLGNNPNNLEFRENVEELASTFLNELMSWTDEDIQMNKIQLRIKMEFSTTPKQIAVLDRMFQRIITDETVNILVCLGLINLSKRFREQSKKYQEALSSLDDYIDKKSLNRTLKSLNLSERELIRFLSIASTLDESKDETLIETKNNKYISNILEKNFPEFIKQSGKVELINEEFTNARKKLKLLFEIIVPARNNNLSQELKGYYNRKKSRFNKSGLADELFVEAIKSEKKRIRVTSSIQKKNNSRS